MIAAAVDDRHEVTSVEPSGAPAPAGGDGADDGRDGGGRLRRFLVRLGVAGVAGLLVAVSTLSLNLFDIADRLPCDFMWKDSCPIEQLIEVTGYHGVDEWVELTNTGADPVDLARWEVRDRAGHAYRFMGFTLEPGASVVLHTGHGEDSATDVYWNRDDHVFNDDTEQVVVIDADGDQVDSYIE